MLLGQLHLLLEAHLSLLFTRLYMKCILNLHGEIKHAVTLNQIMLVPTLDVYIPEKPFSATNKRTVLAPHHEYSHASSTQDTNLLHQKPLAARESSEKTA